MDPLLVTTPSQTAYDINTDYDAKISANLAKRLKRTPSQDEVINSDFDSDLVNETLWQIIGELNDRITALENKKIV